MSVTDQLIYIDAEDPKFYADLLCRIPRSVNRATVRRTILSRRPPYSGCRCHALAASTDTFRYNGRYLTLLTKQGLRHDGQFK